MTTIQVSDDEALVLFELLSRYESGNSGRVLAIELASERNALWALCAQLEKQLVAPLAPNYADQLSAARERLTQRGGDW
jgi:hypothetical protein